MLDFSVIEGWEPSLCNCLIDGIYFGTADRTKHGETSLSFKVDDIWEFILCQGEMVLSIRVALIWVNLPTARHPVARRSFINASMVYGFLGSFARFEIWEERELIKKSDQIKATHSDRT